MKSPYYVIPDGNLLTDASFAYGESLSYDKRQWLARLTANERAQRKLQSIAYLANYLRGMGSGAETSGSGETAIFKTLPERPVIFDVGANHGDYAAAALDVRRQAAVHCFEPSRKTFDILSNKIGGRAHLNNVGLSDADGSATLFSNKAGSGLASLTKRRLDHFGTSMDMQETVELRSLDSYCAEHAVARIDLLKLDVEGHEMDVLKGASRMLDEKRIGMLVFEFGGCDIDTRTFFQDFWYFFQNLGATSISRITPGGWLAPVKKYSEDLEYFRATNYVVRF